MVTSDIDYGLVTTGSPVDGGCAYVAFGTPSAYPTSAAEAISSLTDYTSAGDLSEDGFTVSKSVTTNKFKGWHGDVALKKISEEENTFKLSLIETGRATAAKLRYGSGNVTVDEDGIVSNIKAVSGTDENVSLVIDELEDTGYLRRTVVYKASIDSFDDITHQKGSLVSYGFTFTCLKTAEHPVYEVFRAKPATA